MLTKEPGTRAPTPWHQDQPYYNVAGEQNVSFWIPVDPVRRHSTLEFVAGSHRGPWLMPRSFMDHQAKWFPEGSLQEMPDIEATRAERNILGWALEPGEWSLPCWRCMPRAVWTATGGGAFSLRVLGDDMVHAPRARVTPRPSPAWPTGCPRVCRWTTRCSGAVGAR